MTALAFLKSWFFWGLVAIRKIFVVGGFFGLMTYPISYDWASLLVRLATGITLLPWGIKKLATLRGKSARQELPQMFAVGPFSARAGFIAVMMIELIVPVCLIFGLCTRLIVIPCICSMAVAFNVSRDKYLASPASVYCLLMIAIFFIGSGKYSLDYLLLHSI